MKRMRLQKLDTCTATNLCTPFIPSFAVATNLWLAIQTESFLNCTWLGICLLADTAEPACRCLAVEDNLFHAVWRKTSLKPGVCCQLLLFHVYGEAEQKAGRLWSWVMVMSPVLLIWSVRWHNGCLHETRKLSDQKACLQFKSVSRISLSSSQVSKYWKKKPSGF